MKPGRPKTTSGELRRIQRQRRLQAIRDEGLNVLKRTIDTTLVGGAIALSERDGLLLERLRNFSTAVLREHSRRAAAQRWL